MHAGYCTHPERIVAQGGRWKSIKFPAIFAFFEHEFYGNILFDTGYSESFYAETSRLPFKIYAKLTPVYLKKGECAAGVLESHGIRPGNIDYIILSHFHADHIGGLKDFKKARFIYNPIAYAGLMGKTKFTALRKGFLRGLVPEDFEERSLVPEEKMKVDISGQLSPFSCGYDLFGDGSIILVDLPGHTKGQLGALVRDKEGRRVFFVADAVWQSKAYKELIRPSRIANIIMDNCDEYMKTLGRIHEVYKQRPEIKIIPSHCMEELEGEFHG
nr:MBL fold metallo-hydrolase [Anaerosolibacter carboniphilus]